MMVLLYLHIVNTFMVIFEKVLFINFALIKLSKPISKISRIL